MRDTPIDLSTPCDVWPGGKTGKGYGSTTVDGRSVYVHRLAWEAEYGPIPEGLVIDHECRNRACRNVLHLKPKTSAENTHAPGSQAPQAINAAKTHCAHGHPFDEANTRHTARGKRECRACDREKARRRRAKESHALQP